MDELRSLVTARELVSRLVRRENTEVGGAGSSVSVVFLGATNGTAGDAVVSGAAVSNLEAGGGTEATDVGGVVAWATLGSCDGEGIGSAGVEMISVDSNSDGRRG
ncbi:MAG TPA: hypothetical protein VL486_03590 [Verrucomicrobiae bacterium]|nr:hypothetical protein [Verrucomicrobiae bacterium]